MAWVAFSPVFAQEHVPTLHSEPGLAPPLWHLLPVAIVVGLLLWGLISPRVGRVYAKVFAVLAIGAGVGVLVWGICAAAMGEEIRSLAAFPTLITSPGEAIGLGAGLLVAGVTAMTLALPCTKGRLWPSP